MRKTLIALLATLLVVALVPAASAGAGGGPKPDYFVDEEKLPFDALADATAYWGVHTGAGYRIEVPHDWNGELVVWAHGFRGTGLELTVDNHPLRPLLISLGYAWAASSYSRNDYDITTGVQDTHALVKRFNGIVGKPDKVYLTGARFLEDLRKRLGDELFFEFLRDYYTQYLGKRATSADFFRVLREHTAADISDLMIKYFKNTY